MIKAKPEVESLTPYAAPLEGRRSLLRLDFNESTIGPSPRVVEAIRSLPPEAYATYPEYAGLNETFAATLGVPAEHVEGLYSCLDWYQNVDDAFSKELLKRYNERFPGSAQFTAGSACSGMYRGLKLWEHAVNEAGSLNQDAVVKALNHATIANGPGGPAEMVPGQHHLRLHMYIAQAHNATFDVVKSLGVIEPKERVFA